ncbi:MAG TPA: ABC transporter substrate-binding protein [Pseudolabrys sp.]|nr:ABC transporter substrate-binding protein [Pseudolabrys sp.]
MWHNKISRRIRFAIAAILLGATPALAQQDVNIGLLAPFSGLWAEQGRLMRIGAEMAIEDINKQGGIKSMGGAKLKLVVADTGATVETATNAAQRLLSSGNISALDCCWLSSFTLAAREIAERLHVPILTFASNDGIVQGGYKYIFRSGTGTDLQVRTSIVMIKDAAAKAGGKIQTGALIGDNTAVTVSYFKNLEELLPKNGVKIVLNRVWTPPLSDAIPVAVAVRDANPDVIFLGTTTFDDSVAIIRALNAVKIKRPVLGTGAQFLTPEFFKALGPAAVDGVMATQGSAITKNPFAAEFLERFKKRTNEGWTVHNTTSSYAELWIIKEALEKAGSADPVKVRDALASMNSKNVQATAFLGVDVHFEPNGQNAGALNFIVQWQDGKPMLVSPPEMATAPIKMK